MNSDSNDERTPVRWATAAPAISATAKTIKCFILQTPFFCCKNNKWQTQFLWLISQFELKLLSVGSPIVYGILYSLTINLLLSSADVATLVFELEKKTVRLMPALAQR